ncbi:MAG TPA: hypothetical protein VKC60_04710 [Opitutaceae bacterium]|nr:hypothetical protein [Opitutaceae bacterium]
MFANLFQFLSRKPSVQTNYNQAFIKEVTIRHRSARSRRLERVIAAGWILIGVKCALVVWAINHWHVPIDPLWVIAPTIAMAALCTLVYWKRE